MNQPELNSTIEKLLKQFTTDTSTGHQAFFETLASTTLTPEQLQTLAQEIKSRIENPAPNSDNE